jgi:tetratricopeptide (TPR) repeat protein
LGLINYLQGDYITAKAYLKEALLQAYQIKAKSEITAGILNGLGAVAVLQEDYEEAILYYQKALVVNQESATKIGLARTLKSLGIANFMQGKYEEVQNLFRDSLELYREYSDKRGMAIVLSCWGNVAIAENRFEEAQRLFKESLAIAWEIGHLRNVGESLIGLASAVAGLNDSERATVLCGVTALVLSKLASKLEPVLISQYKNTEQRLRLKLGNENFSQNFDSIDQTPLLLATQGEMILLPILDNISPL